MDNKELAKKWFIKGISYGALAPFTKDKDFKKWFEEEYNKEK